MKLLLLGITLICNSYAATFKIIGPCSDAPVHAGEIESKNLRKSVGEYTISYLNKNNIAYVGNEQGLNSIIGTPIGLDAMEILSDEQMRSHGWCYSVDGEIPDSLANEVRLNNEDSEVVWFYGYSFYDRGEWSEYCTPTYKVRPDQFCK